MCPIRPCGIPCAMATIGDERLAVTIPESCDSEAASNNSRHSPDAKQLKYLRGGGSSHLPLWDNCGTENAHDRSRMAGLYQSGAHARVPPAQGERSQGEALRGGLLSASLVEPRA